MESESPRILICGGGIAGLAAAKTLISNGIENVTILEAGNRVGGRIHSKEFGGNKLEVGAQFIHGNGENPIYKLAASHDLLAESSLESESDSDSEADSEDGDFFTPDGKLIPKQIVNEVCSVIDRIFEDANKFYREGCPLDDREESIGTYTHRQFYKYLRTSCAAESEETIRMREGVFNWKFLNEKADNACRSLYETSIIAWGEYVECLDSNNEYSDYITFRPEHGFGSVVNLLLDSIPKSSVQLSTPVQCIRWDQQRKFHDRSRHSDLSAKESTSPVLVQTSDGREFSADHIIVTCSVGFLKRNAHHMFKPLLPNDKLAAIHRMGFGTVNKIFLEFAQPWWDKDIDGIQFAWTNGEPFALHSVDNAKAAELLRKDWYRGIQGFDALEGFPNWLVGWVAGEEAEMMETIPEQVVLDVCHELLQRFCGRPDISKPTRLIRSTWNSERYICGSYSYHKVGQSAVDCDVLAKPVCSESVPRVLFAGEATHRQFFSTTHGAMLSGEREAKRLIQFYSDSACRL